MTKVSAWHYLDTLVDRKNSVEFKKMQASHSYAVCINGHYFGIGNSCKLAFLDALKDNRRHRNTNAR